MKYIIILSSTLFVLTLFGSSQACQEGSYWVFKIERRSGALSTSRDLNGTYKVECAKGSLNADNGDTQYFSNTVPSVPAKSSIRR